MTRIGRFLTPKERIGHFPVHKLRKTVNVFGYDGCFFDFDPRFGTDTVTGGASVSSWDDKLNVYNVGGSANRPTYNTSDANFNNYPSIQFAASARLQNTKGNIGIPRNFTIVAVAKVDTIQNRNIIYDDSAPTEQGLLMAGSAAGINGIGYYNGSTSLLSGSTEDTAAHIIVLTNNEIWVDGVLEASGSFTSQSIVKIGGTTNVSLRGPLARLLGFNHIVGDRQKLSDNVNQQYLVY